MINFSTGEYMHKPTTSETASAPLFASRPDTPTEQIVETAVRMVMEVGLSAAEQYLHRQGVDKRTSLCVISQVPEIRRKKR